MAHRSSVYASRHFVFDRPSFPFSCFFREMMIPSVHVITLFQSMDELRLSPSASLYVSPWCYTVIKFLLLHLPSKHCLMIQNRSLRVHVPSASMQYDEHAIITKSKARQDPNYAQYISCMLAFIHKYLDEKIKLFNLFHEKEKWNNF